MTIYTPYLRVGLFVSALFATTVSPAAVVTFSFEGLGDNIGRGVTEVFSASGLALTLEAMNNHDPSGGNRTLASGGATVPPGVSLDGLGVNAGDRMEGDQDEVQRHAIDSGGDDEGVQGTFGQSFGDLGITQVSIKIAGFGDFEVFRAVLPEFAGGAYVNGTGDGDLYGDGFDEDVGNFLGPNNTMSVLVQGGFLGTVDPTTGAPTSLGMVNVDITDLDTNFFLVTASDSGSGNLVIQEVAVTVVPVPAALPMIASALALVGWVRRRRRRL